MTEQKYLIRTMTAAEIALAVDWAAAEGWNPGHQDADCFYQGDRQGFFVGLLDGEPIATISAVKYNQEFGFIGFYIVKPEYRGQGYGWQIWQRALDYLQGCNIGLDGVWPNRQIIKNPVFIWLTAIFVTRVLPAAYRPHPPIWSL